MPLVVPVLRFFVVFLNVYETFKTLKPPPPSARRVGRPSVRAVTQRKRDLKGCLAVWVVWCCYAVYERTFDRVVGILLPFYSEIKSVFLLFLVLTRAKGAEPLFLHVLRPLVKPYAAVVDPMLELSRDIGDFIFALLQAPMDYALSSSWSSFRRAEEPEEGPDELSSSVHVASVNSISSTRTSSQSSIPILVNHSGAVQTARMQNQRHGTIRGISDGQRANGHPATDDLVISRGSHNQPSRSTSAASLPAYTEYPSHDPPQHSRIPSKRNGHQMWYPHAAHPGSSQGAPTPLPEMLEVAPEYHSPEWRTYPAFPSAYPPTPLPASASLPSSGVARSGNDHRFVSDSTYPPIPEDEQGFGKTLEIQHERHPGLVYGSSNHNILSGVNGCQENSDVPQQPDEDTLDDGTCSSEPGLSEDGFGSSLRTPHRSQKVMLSSACSSVESLTSPLTTVNNAFPLRTKTSADSSSSGSSSLAGRKRTHGAFQGSTWSTISASHSQNATLRGRPTPPPILRDPLQSSASEGEGESEVSDNDDSTKAKRQRVFDPLMRKSTVRPTTRGTGNPRRAPLARRPVTAVPQATARTRAGSVTTNNSTLKGRKLVLASRQVAHSRLGVAKSSSTSSSQSGTLRGRGY